MDHSQNCPELLKTKQKKPEQPVSDEAVFSHVFWITIKCLCVCYKNNTYLYCLQQNIETGVGILEYILRFSSVITAVLHKA